MRRFTLLPLLLFFAAPCFGQLVLSTSINGTVQAPIDGNGWKNFKVTLTQNVTTFQFVGVPTPAQGNVIVEFVENATGGFSVTFSSWTAPFGGPTISITSACTVNVGANATTICSFTFDGTINTWIGTSLANGPVPSLNSIIFVDGVTYPKTGAGIIAATLAACGGPGGTSNGRVIIPPGTYAFTSPGWNLTNMTGCTFEGASAFASSPGDSSQTGTVLTFNYAPGAGTAGVDISGSINLEFENIVFKCGTSTANAPTACFLHGRTSGSNGIQNKLVDCFVVGYSPWIYYNYRGEQFSSIDTAYFEYAATGVPVTLSYANTAGLTSPYVSFAGSASQSIGIFTGSRTILSSQSTTSTAPNNSLLYLDEGSGIIQGPSFYGYANETVATNAVLVQDTASATGSIQNATFNLQVDSNAASNNTYFNISGNATYWKVDGKINPLNNTLGPALNFTRSITNGILKINTNVQALLTSPICAGTILISDPGGTVSCTSPLAVWYLSGVGVVVDRLVGEGSFVSSGPGLMTIAGTGACATNSSALGGQMNSSFKCTGTSGAATITLTPSSVAAPNEWNCWFADKTTPADTITPTVSGTPTTTCTASAAAIASGDLIEVLTFAH
jgi:hypothetical protein